MMNNQRAMKLASFETENPGFFTAVKQWNRCERLFQYAREDRQVAYESVRRFHEICIATLGVDVTHDLFHAAEGEEFLKLTSIGGGDGDDAYDDNEAKEKRANRRVRFATMRKSKGSCAKEDAIEEEGDVVEAERRAKAPGSEEKHIEKKRGREEDRSDENSSEEEEGGNESAASRTPPETRRNTRSRTCSGCSPIFQPNQLAHMDYGGCMYEDDDDDGDDAGGDDDGVEEEKDIKGCCSECTSPDYRRAKEEQEEEEEQESYCSGCSPVYQPNQLAHMEVGGCLYRFIADE